MKSGFTVDARGKEREDRIDRILLTTNSKNREFFFASLFEQFWVCFKFSLSLFSFLLCNFRVYEVTEVSLVFCHQKNVGSVLKCTEWYRKEKGITKYPTLALPFCLGTKTSEKTEVKLKSEKISKP